MMRQAGRYQAVYRKLAEKHPSFRERSETPELIVEITLQPFESFRPDGVILFSDILTPLPAVGIPFEIDNEVGPVLEKTIRSKDDMSMMHDIDLSKVSFTGEALTTVLREQLGVPLIAMMAVTGLLLQAELHKQAKNETQAPLQAMERPSQPAKGPFQFRGFHSAKVQP